MNLLRTSLGAPLALALLTAAAPAAEVEVLRGRAERTFLGSNGNGGVIERATATIDLRVEDLAYAKEVGVRYTLDDWRTWTDAAGSWVTDLADGAEHWRVELDVGTVGRNMVVGGGRGDMGPPFVRFAAFYRVGGRTYWDNGRGADHAVALVAPDVAPLPEARRAPRTLLVDGDLYLIGGREPEAYGFTVLDLLRLGPDGRWARVAALPSLPEPGNAGPPVDPRILTGFEVAAIGRRIYVLGGSRIKVGGVVRSVVCFDLDRGAWEVAAPLPGPLEDRRAVVRGDELHLVPTTAQRGWGDTALAYVYDAGAGAWRTRTVGGLALLAGERYVTAAAGERLYLLGGRVGGPGGGWTSLRDVLVYEAATGAVRRAGSLPVDLSGAERAVVSGGRVLVTDVAADLGRGRARLLAFDPLAGDARLLGERRLLPFGASLAALPPRTIGQPAGPSEELAPILVFGGGSGVDTWDPARDALARGAVRTVIRVHAPLGPGRRLTLRGGAAPLRWDRGADCTWTPGDVWVFETTELLLPSLAFKPLIDDARWMAGADERVARGSTRTITFR